MIDKDKILTSTNLREIQVKDKMSCFVLFGENSCGKSSTLNHLIVLLNGGGVLRPQIQNAFESKFLKTGKEPYYKDSRHIIHYKREKDGKEAVIYLSTMGDNWELVEQSFRFFYRITDGNTIVYKFDGKKFTKVPKLNSWEPPCPEFCISPANFHKGAIQAERYFLDMTCLDWKRERWIFIEKLKNEEELGDPVSGYEAGIIKEKHEQIANEIIDEINRMMDQTSI